MINILAVFIGGGLGSLCRYAFGLYIPSASFPLATLLANTCACFILGCMTGFFLKNNLGNHLKLLIGTGFCGGFSTFSTFSKETLELGQNTFSFITMSYIFLSIALGMLAVLGGMAVSNLK
ncbi:MAG: fluoride efflux transporter CrcB [Saprospiraceae bacterium]|nr:fluoride efflux transporter CrcB [Saprospiraceae bacterium]